MGFGIFLNIENIIIIDNAYLFVILSGNKADLILHPIRLQILKAFSGGRHLSARQLCEILPDIPQATLYRHFHKLAQAGILTIAEERPIRGTVEKFYSLQEQNTELLAEDLKALSREDHQRYFTTFVATLLTDFAQYLQREEIDIVQDGVGYRQVALYLSNEEINQLTQALNEALKPFLKKKPSKRRNRFLLSSIFMPGD